jgi:hypothetical protein
MPAIDTNPHHQNRKRIVVSIPAKVTLNRNNIDVGDFIKHLETLTKICHADFARVSRHYKDLQIDIEGINELSPEQKTLKSP